MVFQAAAALRWSLLLGGDREDTTNIWINKPFNYMSVMRLFSMLTESINNTIIYCPV